VIRERNFRARERKRRKKAVEREARERKRGGKEEEVGDEELFWVDVEGEPQREPEPDLPRKRRKLQVRAISQSEQPGRRRKREEERALEGDTKRSAPGRPRKKSGTKSEEEANESLLEAAPELERQHGSEPAQTQTIELSGSGPPADKALSASLLPEQPKRTRKKRKRQEEVNAQETVPESEQQPEARPEQSRIVGSEPVAGRLLFSSPPPELTERTKQKNRCREEVGPALQPEAALFDASATPGQEQPGAGPAQTQNTKLPGPEPAADKSLFASATPEQQELELAPLTSSEDAGPPQVQNRLKNNATADYSDWENSKPRTRCSSEAIWDQSTEEEEEEEEEEETKEGSFYTTRGSSTVPPTKLISKAEETPREVPPLPGESPPPPTKNRAESPSLFDEDVPWAEIRTRESSPAGESAVLGLSQIMRMGTALPSNLPSVLPEDIEDLADIFGSDAEVAAELEAEQDQTVVRAVSDPVLDTGMHSNSTQLEEDEVELPPLLQKSPSKKRSKKTKPSRKEVEPEDTQEKTSQSAARSSSPLSCTRKPAPLNAGKGRLVEIVAGEENPSEETAPQLQNMETKPHGNAGPGIQGQAPTPNRPAPTHYTQNHSYTPTPAKTLTDYFRPLPPPTTFSVVIPVPPRDPESDINPDFILILFLSNDLPADWRDTAHAAMKDLDAAIRMCCVSKAEVVVREGEKAQMAIVCRGKENAFRLVQNTVWRRPLEEVLGMCGSGLENYVVKSQVE